MLFCLDANSLKDNPLSSARLVFRNESNEYEGSEKVAYGEDWGIIYKMVRSSNLLIDKNPMFKEIPRTCYRELRIETPNYIKLQAANLCEMPNLDISVFHAGQLPFNTSIFGIIGSFLYESYVLSVTSDNLLVKSR